MHEGLSANRTEEPNILHAISESRLELLEERLNLFSLVRLRFVFQIFARRRLVDGLQIDIRVLVDLTENDLIELVIENENFQVLLLINLEKGRGAKK